MKRQIALVLGGVVAGLALGWQLWQPPAPVVEPYAPPVRQADSSLVLERKPDARAAPPHAIPEGAVVERVATVTVQPDAVSRADSVRSSANDSQNRNRTPEESQSCNCAPVHVDLSLVRLTDGSRRVIASARGGTIIGGVDVPVERAAPARVLRWAAGPEYDLLARRWGGFADYDAGALPLLGLPARVGLSVTPDARGIRVGLRLGLRW